MRAPITETELRAAWQHLRMIGDFDSSMRHRAVRRVVESAARAMQARGHDRRRYDAKRRAANDRDE
ncbi:hypothetical protein PQR34_19610 [Paraburkholderia sediminicola]|uniref:hypothetical protein n=1 Tax=Paraburkholderia sediminicola TaxID=458836 RepID=UPI0038B98394